MRLAVASGGIAFVISALSLSAQTPATSARAYSEGPVTVMSYVRTKPGMFERYMEYLNGQYKQSMEAEKSAGLVLGYAVHTSAPRTPQDHDLILSVTYRNWAAFDGLADRSDAVANRARQNTPRQRDQEFIDRAAMREVLGTRNYQQLLLK
ncbi:MAG: hypothetical protein H0U59_09955 [Gemmatimonadaceae bacterium]|nr:hypothetical protein [Gemmatimonadaceae bacterium]